jgi:predicted aldo/keto reductase-like oxidoreductase
MDHRRFRNGEEISILGLGVMRMPYAREGRKFIDEKLGLEMVDYAISNGINYFDTAYIYHGCTSEAFIGRALSRYSRDRFKLATKMPIWMLETAGGMEAIFAEQLEKCRVEFFDCYLIHNLSSQTMELEERLRVYEFLAAKKREGRIRRLGFSIHDDNDVFKSALTKYDWDFVQIQLNYLDWEGQNAREKYEFAAGRGVPVIVMEPVRGGTLANMCAESTRIFKSATPRRSVASWAVRYAASLSGVITVLSGMSSLAQMKDNVSSVSPLIPLSGDDYATIDAALEAHRRNAPVPCTACGYCMDCPFGVDIPKIFALYNQYKPRGRSVHLAQDYRSIGPEHGAGRCTGCGRCVSLCPQKLDIPSLIEEAGIFIEANALDESELLQPEKGVKIVERL